LHVAEVEPQAWVSGDREDVVHVEMPLAGQLGPAQLVQHRVDRQLAEACQPEGFDERRLPPTPSAAPLVSHEAQHAQTFVIRIVTAFGRRSATVVVPSLHAR
jgi:hypothetical protein